MKFNKAWIETGTDEKNMAIRQELFNLDVDSGHLLCASQVLMAKLERKTRLSSHVGLRSENIEG